MRKKRFNKKLNLNKETISNFESSKILGGKAVLTGGVCPGPGGASVDFPDGTWCTATNREACPNEYHERITEISNDC